jgi:hypothetical protein
MAVPVRNLKIELFVYWSARCISQQNQLESNLQSAYGMIFELLHALYGVDAFQAVTKDYKSF